MTVVFLSPVRAFGYFVDLNTNNLCDLDQDSTSNKLKVVRYLLLGIQFSFVVLLHRLYAQNVVTRLPLDVKSSPSTSSILSYPCLFCFDESTSDSKIFKSHVAQQKSHTAFLTHDRSFS